MMPVSPEIVGSKIHFVAEAMKYFNDPTARALGLFVVTAIFCAVAIPPMRYPWKAVRYFAAAMIVCAVKWSGEAFKSAGFLELAIWELFLTWFLRLDPDRVRSLLLAGLRKVLRIVGQRAGISDSGAVNGGASSLAPPSTAKANWEMDFPDHQGGQPPKGN